MKLRVFDNPSTIDRYTVVVIEHEPGPYAYLCMSVNPLSQDGMCYAGAVTHEWVQENTNNEIQYQDLPEPCRKYVELEIMGWPHTTQ